MFVHAVLCRLYPRTRAHLRSILFFILSSAASLSVYRIYYILFQVLWNCSSLLTKTYGVILELSLATTTMLVQPCVEKLFECFSILSENTTIQ